MYLPDEATEPDPTRKMPEGRKVKMISPVNTERMSFRDGKQLAKFLPVNFKVLRLYSVVIWNKENLDGSLANINYHINKHIYNIY